MIHIHFFFSPVFRKKTPLSVNISPIKKSNSASTLSFSPPGGALSLPGQPSFTSERAEAIRRKKMKDKISNRLVNNGLSPVKRLSPDKAGFIKSSSLVSSSSGYTKSPSKKGGACVLDSLKRDMSPNMLCSPNLYERIKGRHRNKVQNKAVSKVSARCGWPSDSDSSEDEILAGAVDSLQQHRTKSSTNKQSVSTNLPLVKTQNKDVVQMFQDSDDDLEFINPQPVMRHKHNSRSATQTSAKSPAKSETISNHSSAKSSKEPSKSPAKVDKICRNSDYEERETLRRCKHPEWCGSVVSNSSERRCDRNCDRQMSPHLANLTTMCSNLSRLQTVSKDNLSNTGGSNYSNSTDSQTSSHYNETDTLVPSSRLERKRKHGTDSRFSSVDLTGPRNSIFSRDDYMTGSQTPNNSNETGAPLSRLERKKKREAQSGTSLQDSNVTGVHSPPSRQERKRRLEAQSRMNSQTGAHNPASRQERKRRHEAQSEGWMSKIPRPTGTTRTKTPTKDRITGKYESHHEKNCVIVSDKVKIKAGFTAIEAS